MGESDYRYPIVGGLVFAPTSDQRIDRRHGIRRRDFRRRSFEAPHRRPHVVHRSANRISQGDAYRRVEEQGQRRADSVPESAQFADQASRQERRQGHGSSVEATVQRRQRQQSEQQR